MKPTKLNSILFLGDSFTWGQGLQYYHLIENEGWDWKKCSNCGNGGYFIKCYDWR